MEIVIDCLSFFMIGFTVSWFVFDRFFYQPLGKLNQSAMRGWLEAIKDNVETIDKLIKLKESKKLPDGSIISPIQPKRDL